jgi:hypothetical protein
MKYVLLSISVLISVNFFACKKEELSKTEILTESKWFYQDAKRNGISIYASVRACVRDNMYFFKTNGELTIDEGNVKCSPSDPQSINFSWFFFSNEDSISISNFRTKVIELSKTQFITEQTNQAGDIYLYIYGK